MSYKEKLIKEYNELKNNIESLNKIMIKWECFNLKYSVNKQDKLKQADLEKELGFSLNFPFELLENQLYNMEEYLHILELRIELIDIENEGNKNILLS